MIYIHGILSKQKEKEEGKEKGKGGLPRQEKKKRMIWRQNDTRKHHSWYQHAQNITLQFCTGTVAQTPPPPPFSAPSRSKHIFLFHSECTVCKQTTRLLLLHLHLHHLHYRERFSLPPTQQCWPGFLNVHTLITCRDYASFAVSWKLMGRVFLFFPWWLIVEWGVSIFPFSSSPPRGSKVLLSIKAVHICFLSSYRHNSDPSNAILDKVMCTTKGHTTISSVPPSFSSIQNKHTKSWLSSLSWPLLSSSSPPGPLFCNGSARRFGRGRRSGEELSVQPDFWSRKGFLVFVFSLFAPEVLVQLLL